MPDADKQFYRDDWETSSRHLTEAGYAHANALIDLIRNGLTRREREEARQALLEFAHIPLDHIVANELEVAKAGCKASGQPLNPAQEELLLSALQDYSLHALEQVTDSITQPGADPDHVEQVVNWSDYFQHIQSKVKAARKREMPRIERGDAEQLLTGTAEHIAAPETLDNDVATRLLAERMITALQSLPDEERQVITLRYGLGENGRSHTLDEVAIQLGKSTEQVRTIESGALKKILRPTREPEAVVAEQAESLDPSTTAHRDRAAGGAPSNSTTRSMTR